MTNYIEIDGVRAEIIITKEGLKSFTFKVIAVNHELGRKQLVSEHEFPESVKDMQKRLSKLKKGKALISRTNGHEYTFFPSSLIYTPSQLLAEKEAELRRLRYNIKQYFNDGHLHD